MVSKPACMLESIEEIKRDLKLLLVVEINTGLEISVVRFIAGPVLPSTCLGHVVCTADQELSIEVNCDRANLPAASRGTKPGAEGLEHRLFVARRSFEWCAKKQPN
ncbi:hypothetical protein MAGR_29920 [Mycolicibacterium agri]|uniref:Uncharacterized protein n=1 Tax=Mycolicibacterium agri TaxID=36811 RepID=A0A7I9W1H1_MYCAG|nr:hypothetical protein MAGR_29920 [Mycolicibacterium agri]